MAEEKQEHTVDMDAASLMAAVEDVNQTIDKFLDTASVGKVYGEPIHVGDTVIIPSAEVVAGMGFGVGVGYGRRGEESHQTGGGSGGGGGGQVLSRPVAVIVATPEEVRIEHVYDRTKITLAALTAAGFMVGMVARMLRGR